METRLYGNILILNFFINGRFFSLINVSDHLLKKSEEFYSYCRFSSYSLHFFTHSFINPSIYSFIRSFVHLFIHSFSLTKKWSDHRPEKLVVQERWSRMETRLYGNILILNFFINGRFFSLINVSDHLLKKSEEFYSYCRFSSYSLHFFTHSFINPSIYSFIRSFVHLFIYSFIFWFFLSFINSFICYFT